MYTTSQAKKVRRGATLNQHPPGHPFHAHYYAVVGSCGSTFIFGVKFCILVLKNLKIMLKKIQSFFENLKKKFHKKSKNLFMSPDFLYMVWSTMVAKNIQGCLRRFAFILFDSQI